MISTSNDLSSEQALTRAGAATGKGPQNRVTGACPPTGLSSHAAAWTSHQANLNYHNSKGKSLMRRTAAILLGTASLLPIIIKTVTALGALR